MFLCTSLSFLESFILPSFSSYDHHAHTLHTTKHETCLSRIKREPRVQLDLKRKIYQRIQQKDLNSSDRTIRLIPRVTLLAGRREESDKTKLSERKSRTHRIINSECCVQILADCKRSH